MKRRHFLRCTAILPLIAHTPYPQWKVYRQRHLFIVTNKADPRSYELGQAIVETLLAHLPASRAMVTRATDAAHTARLITTKQLDVAILKRSEVADWLAAAVEPVALRSLAAFDEHLLICREDFPARHAYLIAETLQQHQRLSMAALTLENESLMPVHAGVLEYYKLH
ncbi:MAG: hypothetical protein ACFB4I_06475 [Cyanophyceae cyanobacterium]